MDWRQALAARANMSAKIVGKALQIARALKFVTSEPCVIHMRATDVMLNHIAELASRKVILGDVKPEGMTAHGAGKQQDV